MSEKPLLWYEAWFDRDEYEIVYRHRDDRDAERLIDLVEKTTGVQRGNKIADIGCGRGRHAILLARRGYRVTGLDLSERSIAVARSRAHEEDLDIDFVIGDMREPVCGACFDGAVNLFTAFGYFEHEDDHQRATEAIAVSIKPGGWFVQDFLNPPYVRDTFVPEDRRTEIDIEIVQRRRIEEGRIRKTITLSRNGRTHAFEESVRLLELADFRMMYERAGLRIVQVYGDAEGRPYGPGSKRMIMHSVRDKDV